MRIGYPVAVQLGLPFDEQATIAPAPVRTRVRATGRLDAVSSPQFAAASPLSQLAPVYFVRHRRARRYLLRLDADGRLRVTIPRGGSKREADEFAARHVDWVQRQRARLVPSRFPAEERSTLMTRARAELPRRLMELAALHGQQVSRISIRDQRTRWGSCARDGHICLNWRLVVMPDWVRDYVMIHELMHLERMDHSAAYWRLVAAACPAFREARQWLRAHGSELR